MDGLVRSSGAAKVLGLTLEETISILTVMREATGRTGREVGNALNSILSFMQRPSAIKTFEAEGIRVFADEARTQFRNVINIFDELAAKWPQLTEATQNMFVQQAEAAGLYSEEMAEVIGIEEQWTDLQQRDLSSASAGIYRRNYLLALLKNWAKVDEVLISMEDSLGYSLRENERTMDTLDKQYKALKASAEAFAVAIGDAGLLNEITTLVTGAKDLVQWFNNLDDSMQTLLITFAEITLAMKLLATIGKMAGISGAMGAGGIAMSATTKKTRGLVASVTALNTALKNTGKGIVAAFGGPQMLAVIGVTTALTTLHRIIKDTKEEIREHGATAEKLVVEYDSLQGKLRTLKEGTESYAKAEERLAQFHDEIGHALPELIEGHDEVNGHLDINIDKMREMAQMSSEYAKSLQNIQEKHDALMESLSDEKEQHLSTAEQMEKDIQKIPELIKRREQLRNIIEEEGRTAEETELLKTQLGETDNLIATIAMRAGLTREEADNIVIESIDEVIEKIKEKKKDELDAAKTSAETQVEETGKLKDETLKRVGIINEEIQALLAKQAVLQGKSSKAFYRLSPVGKVVYGVKNLINKKEISEKQKEMDEANNLLKEQEKQIEQYQKNVEEIIEKISAIPIGSADIPTLGDGSGGDTSGGSAGKSIDAIKDAMQQLSDAAEQFSIANQYLESSLSAVNRELSIADAEYNWVNEKIKRGIGNVDDYARVQEITAHKIYLLQTEQKKLTKANEAYEQQIKALTPALSSAVAEYNRFKDAGDAEHTKDAASAVSNLKGEIDNLSSTIASNTSKIYENKIALEELTTSTYTSYFQSAMEWASFMESIGRANTREQLAYLNTFDISQLKLAEQRELRQKAYSKRRELLKEEMNDIKRAYERRMDMYEREIEANERLIESKEKNIERIRENVEAEIAAIQKLIDALDNEGDKEDKEEAERQHNQKLADLAEERLYHELRTGREHQDRIKDIDREIAEENRRWELQKNDWNRDAQRKAYQDQIDHLREQSKKQEDYARQEINNLRKNNDSKKKELQKYWQDIQEIFSDNLIDMMAALTEYSDKFSETISGMFDLAKKGIESGDSGISDALKDQAGRIQDEYNNLPRDEGKPTPPRQESPNAKSKQAAQDRAENARRQLASLGYAQGAADISSYDYDGAYEWYKKYIGSGRTDLSRKVKDLFWEIVSAKRDWHRLDQAHTGAYVQTTGIAELLKGERVLNPQMTVQFDRLASALERMPNIPDRITGSGNGNSIDRAADRIIAAIERRNGFVIQGPAVNVEHAGFNDKADMDIFGRRVRGALVSKG